MASWSRAVDKVADSSVQPGEEGFALDRARLPGDQLGLLPVVALGTVADPEAALLPGEFDDARVGVFRDELRLQADRLALAVEGPEWHAPAAAGVDRLG